MSPENEYYLPNSNVSSAISLGSTIDNSLLRELFREIKEIQTILNMTDETDFVNTLEGIDALLPPLRINYYGGIQEWIEDFQEAIPGIDHLSPLWGAFPGPEITSTNSTTFIAARTTLQHRLANGGGSGGWGASWCAALSARFFDPATVSRCIVHLINNQTIGDSLLNSGAPADFQIDGNFGGPAALAEMLLQSHESISTDSQNSSQLVPASTGTVDKIPVIRLLPAVPPAWISSGNGYVHGLRARGGFEVDINWNSQGQLRNAVISSTLGGMVYVTFGNATILAQQGQALKSGDSPGAVFLKLDTQKGMSYNVTPA